MAFFIVEVDNDGFKVLNTSGTAIDPATQATLAVVQAALDSIKDTAGIKKITDALPAGSNVLGAFRLSDGTNDVTVVLDGVDGKYRLNIVGKVSVVAPVPPPATTPVDIIADTPLVMGAAQSPDDTEHVIPADKTFTLQSVTAGAEGDPSEGGSRIDVIYVDNASVEHLVAREYITGFTATIVPDTSKARDGTAMVGNVSGNTKVIVRRIRLSGGSVEVDAVARGYEDDT